ncbi:hypothetical protein UlMin_004358 [Ulmus minor]
MIFPRFLPTKPPNSPHFPPKQTPPLPPKPSPLISTTKSSTSTRSESISSVINSHPQIISTPLADLKRTVDFISSVGFTTLEFQRLVGTCPEILTSKLADIVPIFTFLIQEAKINGSDLKRNRLRPTLYFLQTIGIAEMNKHPNLLTSSVEEKLILFVQLFCYNIESNFEPKFDYFVVEMGRDLKELKEFPQYFSFSLENQIKPRHQSCVEKGVCFPLPFYDRLEVGCNSSMPVKASPLWCTNYDINSI